MGRPKPPGAHAGSIAGYDPTCGCVDCRRGRKRYEVRRERLMRSGQSLTTSPEVAKRKIQALSAIGWSWGELARRMGISQQTLSKFMLKDVDRVLTSTVRRIDKIYAELEMTPSPELPSLVSRTRNRAARNGWPAPLAWDDIEAGILAPEVKPRGKRPKGYDETIVDFVWEVGPPFDAEPLSGEEKGEICRRWHARGRSLAELGRLTGWEPSRYFKIPTQDAQEAA